MDVKVLAAEKLAQLEQDIFATYATAPSSSLLCGNGALPLFYFKLYSLSGQDDHQQKAAAVLDSLLDQINAGLPSSSHCDGLAGVASMLSYLVEHNILDEDAEAFLIQCDAGLYQAFQKAAARADLDYLHGTVGIAFYFLHRRLATLTVTETLVLVANQLLELVEASLVPTPGQYVNCGVAHGRLALLSFFTKYLPVAPQPARVEAVIRGIVQQILPLKSTDPTTWSQFPSIVRLQDNLEPVDVAYDIPNGWCYGDTVLALVLWGAGDALRDEALQQEAMAIALRSTARDTPRKALVIDAGICHGTAGLAHLYNRWYRATGHPQFRASYEYWITQTLLMGNRPEGPGGFQKASSQTTYTTTYGLLDGACGIGLVLADFVADSSEEPSDWDRFLALS